jgi:hypothetical protein
LRTIKYYNEKKEIKGAGKLSDFLPLDEREWFDDEKAQVLDEGLHTNVEIKLYRETFLLVERAIL